MTSDFAWEHLVIALNVSMLAARDIMQRIQNWMNKVSVDGAPLFVNQDFVERLLHGVGDIDLAFNDRQIPDD